MRTGLRTFLLLNFKSGLPLGAVETAKYRSESSTHGKQAARAEKKSYMCFWCMQTQFLIMYITLIINFFIEKYILALDVAASCLFNLWKVKGASGVA
jgi:hypothetical protein